MVTGFGTVHSVSVAGRSQGQIPHATLHDYVEADYIISGLNVNQILAVFPINPYLSVPFKNTVFRQY
jgi:hypothetical protein